MRPPCAVTASLQIAKPKPHLERSSPPRQRGVLFENRLQHGSWDPWPRIFDVNPVGIGRLSELLVDGMVEIPAKPDSLGCRFFPARGVNLQAFSKRLMRSCSICCDSMNIVF